MGVCDNLENESLPLPCSEEAEDPDNPSTGRVTNNDHQHHHQQQQPLQDILEESEQHVALLVAEEERKPEEFPCACILEEAGTTTTKRKNGNNNLEGGNGDVIDEHPDVDRGWAWVVLLGGIMSLAVVSALFYTFNLYFVLLMDAFQATRGETAWVGSLNSAFFMLAGPLATVSIIRFGSRATIFLGGILSALGFIGSSLSPSLSVLLVTHGVITATGCCLNYAAWITVLGTYFRRRHSLATSFLLSGTGLGLFFYAPILRLVIEEYSWRGSYLINAGLALNFCVFGALVYPLRRSQISADRFVRDIPAEQCPLSTAKPPHKSTSSLYLCGTTASFISHSMSSLSEGRVKKRKAGWFSSDSSVEVQWKIGETTLDKTSHPVQSERGFLHRVQTFLKMCQHKSKGAGEPSKNEIPTKDLFKDIIFLSLLVSSFLWVMACNMIYILYNDFANWQGLGDYFTYALSAMGLGDMFGRIMAGILASSEKVNCVLLFTVSQITCCLCVMGFTLVNSGILLTGMGTLFSLTYGVQNVCIAVVPAKTFGTENLNRIFGFLLFACGLGSLIGAPIAGWIVDTTQSYTAAFIFAAVIELGSAVATCLSWRCSLSKGALSNQKPPAV